MLLLAAKPAVLTVAIDRALRSRIAPLGAEADGDVAIAVGIAGGVTRIGSVTAGEEGAALVDEAGVVLSP